MNAPPQVSVCYLPLQCSLRMEQLCGQLAGITASWVALIGQCCVATGSAPWWQHGQLEESVYTCVSSKVESRMLVSQIDGSWYSPGSGCTFHLGYHGDCKRHQQVYTMLEQILCTIYYFNSCMYTSWITLCSSAIVAWFTYNLSCTDWGIPLPRILHISYSIFI